jgi:hypothetical protein
MAGNRARADVVRVTKEAGMNQQQFQEQPGRHTMTQEEAKAVVALWLEERGEREGVDAGPTTGDVAEALDITPGEARRLLRSVRTRHKAVEKARRRRASVAKAVAATVTIGAVLAPLSKPAVRTVEAPSTAVVSSSPARDSSGGKAYPIQVSRIIGSDHVIFAEGNVRIRGAVGGELAGGPPGISTYQLELTHGSAGQKAR